MRLEQAKTEALARLAQSDDQEVKLSSLDDGRTLWLGMGYCVGRGWATYRGGDHFKITANGLVAYRELQSELST